MEKMFEIAKNITGIDFSLPENIPSEKEYIQSKCDRFNAEKGNFDKFDGVNCDKCKNKGFISKPLLDSDGHWNEVTVACSCIKIRESIRRMKRSGLKNIISKFELEKYETPNDWQKLLKQKAIDFSKNPEDSWFFIGGQSGCGKTHLCTGIAREFLLKEKSVLYMMWRDDITKLKGSITDSKVYEKMISEFKLADVLYIDDLFKNGKGSDGKVQMPTSADIQIAFEILNFRSCNCLTTIISSERQIQEILEIDEALGGRLVERAFDAGYGFNIKKDREKNYRLKNIFEI